MQQTAKRGMQQVTMHRMRNDPKALNKQNLPGQVMVCNETRSRSCHPMPLRKPPYSQRFYVSSQLQWMTTTLEIEPGWQEIVWVYSRDGAVLGNDIAEILDVEWEGTELADTECAACPEGKVRLTTSSFDRLVVQAHSPGFWGGFHTFAIGRYIPPGGI